MNKFESPLAAFLHWEKTTPNNVFFKQPLKGKTTEITYQQAGDQIRRIAAAIASHNFPTGSKIALLSKNCAHWIMSDLAIMMTGNISVPLYPTLNAETVRYVLEHSESKAIIIGKLDDYEKMQKSGVTDIPRISVGFFGEKDGETWESLVAKFQPMAEPVKHDKDDLMTIIYTSGTTGMPKGVMHSWAAFSLISDTLLGVVKTPEQPRFFSYLPLSHVAERIGISLQCIYRGGTVYFPESLESFPADLAAAKPHVFFAVPRVWAKFQEKILLKMPQGKMNLFLKIPILKNIVKKKIKAGLGLSDAGYVASGAAAISVDLLHWFEKLDITIHQVYGMTEDGLLSHFNRPGKNKMGSVGQLLPGATAKLSPEGEILIKSPCLMKGYYKEPEKTAESFTEDGFLKTGDVGEYDNQGYLSIVGRIKDQFKTDKGKYVAPGPIELKLSESHVIEQLCVVGTGIPQPIALITLSEIGKAMDKAALTAALKEALAHLNPSLAEYEVIKKVVVLNENWTIENDFLTPTMKIKRNLVEKKHTANYLKWYNAAGGDVVFAD